MIFVGLWLGWMPLLGSLFVHLQIGKEIADESVVLVQLVAVRLLNGLGGMLFVAVLDENVTLSSRK